MPKNSERQTKAGISGVGKVGGFCEELRSLVRGQKFWEKFWVIVVPDADSAYTDIMVKV